MKIVLAMTLTFLITGCTAAAPKCKCDQAAVVIQHSKVGEVCGTYSGLRCADDAFCDYTDEQMMTFDGSGICVLRPDQCDEPVQDPGVCARDAIRYINACTANKAGYDVYPEGGYNPCK